MHRLRHPVRAIREPFGTAGLVVACIALIAALAGGAIAASGLTGKQKKEVKKIAKQFAGKPGAPGAAGPAGPAGPAGKDGANGSNGSNGADGVSPTGEAFAGNANGCQEGGVKFTGANTTVACNGVKGKSVQIGTATSGETGECPQGGATVQVEGSALTKKAVCNGQTGFTETLPVGATETGTFATSGTYKKFNSIQDSISFSIPLAAELDADHVHAVSETGEEFVPATESFKPADTCFGTALEPTAPSGHLCVYASTNGVAFPAPLIFKPTVGIDQGAGTAGATLNFVAFFAAPATEGYSSAKGSWAVTG